MDTFLSELFRESPIIISFLAGFLSFLSPCILPLLPAYLSYITGFSIDELKNGKTNKFKILYLSLLFVAGFTLVFMIFGATMARLIGGGIYSVVFRYIAGFLVVLFGLHFLGIFRFSIFQTQKEFRINISPRFESIKTILSPFLLGASFALGWSPCVGPIFASIVSLSTANPSFGLSLLWFYALGFGIPLIIVALFANKLLIRIKNINKYMPILEKISGILLIIIGTLIITGDFSEISYFLSNI